VDAAGHGKEGIERGLVLFSTGMKDFSSDGVFLSLAVFSDSPTHPASLAFHGLLEEHG
jgi:hypothetical protein